MTEVRCYIPWISPIIPILIDCLLCNRDHGGYRQIKHALCPVGDFILRKEKLWFEE